MYPRPFDYLAPATIDEAVRELANADYAKVLSGGMSLIPMMKLRIMSPDLVVDIGRIPGLDRIVESNGEASIGALVRHATTADSPSLPDALRSAASWTGDVQVRNRGTTCGAMAHADMAADQTAAALALGATMVVRGPHGPREVAAEDFFVDALTSALEPDEILTALRVPTRIGASAYQKLGRRGGHTDFAIAGAAVWVEKRDGHVVAARVALTGVGVRPELAPTAAQRLVGTDGSDAAVSSAADLVTEDVPMIEDLFGPVEYKAHLARVLTHRALKAALAVA